MKLDSALTMENVYHEIMLRECKTEESQQWENARHTLMQESIKDTIDYYSKYYFTNELCEERER